MTRKESPHESVEHLLVDLQVTKAACSCGAELVLSDALTANLSAVRCQDHLIDLYHQHRDHERPGAEEPRK